jgi:hypothetical protein
MAAHFLAFCEDELLSLVKKVKVKVTLVYGGGERCAQGVGGEA